MGNTAEIQERHKVAEAEMLRIHREMLDIANGNFTNMQSDWFRTWIVEWFNTIKEYWPFQDMSGLLAENARLEAEREAALEELDNAQPCFACAGFRRNGGKCFGAGTCRVRDIAKLEGVEYQDHAHGESWRWRGAQPATGAEESGK